MVTIDIPADLNDEDETGFVWTFLDEARAPELVTPGAIVVTGDALSTANVAAAILDATDGVETGLTLRQALRVIAAATAGKVSGAETTTITFRNALVDDTDRIVATVDVDGNRTAVTLDTD